MTDREPQPGPEYGPEWWEAWYARQEARWEQIAADGGQVDYREDFERAMKKIDPDWKHPGSERP